MGMTAQEYWARSPDGRAMVIMLAERNNPEDVQAILDWLVTEWKRDVVRDTISRGGTVQQANLRGENLAAGLYKQVEGIDERNQRDIAITVIDHCFSRYYKAGAQKYAAALLWFANECRKRWRKVPLDRSGG